MKPDPTPERLLVGARIRAARRNAHMKQAELALAVGVSQGKVSTWECGEFVPDITEWVRLAQVTQDFGMLDLRSLAPTLQVSDRELTVEQPQLPGFRSHLFAVN